MKTIRPRFGLIFAVFVANVAAPSAAWATEAGNVAAVHNTVGKESFLLLLGFMVLIRLGLGGPVVRRR